MNKILKSIAGRWPKISVGKGRKAIGRILMIVILIFFSVIFLLPFFWMLITAFKTSNDILRFPPTWWPNPITFDNFSRAFSALPFGKFYVNSFTIVILSTIGTLLSSALIGYGFARYNVTGSKFFFGLLLASLALPDEVLLIPVFLLFKKMGWLDSILPLVVPSYFGNAFYIFLFRQFFRSIPGELLDAAMIDGVNHFGAFWYIVRPLAAPVVAVVTVFNFISKWNDFFSPLIYLQDVNKMTVAVGLAYFRGESGTDWGALMAASLVSIIPILIVFIIAQKHLVQGISTTGLKG